MLSLSILFSLFYFLMVMYFFSAWLSLRKPETGNQKPETKGLPFVSIVIPIRNEAENISACLNSIFDQSYPQEKFEVIVIDDYSTDSSLKLLEELKNPSLQIIELRKYFGDANEY